MKYYYIMDKEEEGIFISFTDRFEAEEWLHNQPDRLNENSVRYGMHIVEKEVLTPYEIAQKATRLNPIEKWNESYGDCLWWSLPITKSPHVGSPKDLNFPKDLTHFTEIIIPQE